MTKDYEPPADAAKVFTGYREHYEGERELKPAMVKMADRELLAGATVGELARLTGLTPEVFRRRARTLGVERKRPPTVGKLAAAPPPPAAPIRKAAQPRVIAPPARDPGPAPAMSDGRAKVLAALAYERADEQQRAGLDQTAQEVGPAYRDFAVVASAHAMGLITTAELHHVDDAPPATEES
jgi:hypothetical protein